jgi:hypothetical protein
LMKSSNHGKIIKINNKMFFTVFLRDDDTLEYKHGYVQWLFPNHYQSRVNDDAQPLSREEAKIFKTNEKVVI